MAEDRVQSGDDVGDAQEQTGELQGPESTEVQETLAFDLQSIVDDIRTIPAEFGIRAHRVWLVHVVWSGANRGEGTPQVTSRREIVPVPRVRDMDAVRRVLRATGGGEEGDVVVDQISARYPQDDLRGKTPDLQDPQKPRTSRRNVEFWWEIQESRPSWPKPVISRFYVVSASLSRGGMSWRVVLTKQDADRGREGGMARSDF